ncbi:hypothetical protein JOF29_005036 [Kribbella aluminosa]|uniref:Uncharacterized protein n=1 Tax=Kribbella aluminosa TaxID=416017 RepID=A0ABS4UQK6_9ACTN|nr:hypothetical protein [Kribbella aluminosa]MBP2353926.1 hypothetical protein [Kribbella aluminosa]
MPSRNGQLRSPSQAGGDPAGLAAVTNPLVEREWLTGRELTAAGSRALADLRSKVRAQRRRITAGISTEEHLAAVVLRQRPGNLV